MSIVFEGCAFERCAPARFQLGLSSISLWTYFPRLSLEIKAGGIKKRFQLRHDGTGACGDARDGESAGVRAVPCLEVAARAASGDVRAFRREGAALLQVGIRLSVLAGPCM